MSRFFDASSRQFLLRDRGKLFGLPIAHRIRCVEFDGPGVPMCAVTELGRARQSSARPINTARGWGGSGCLTGSLPLPHVPDEIASHPMPKQQPGLPKAEVEALSNKIMAEGLTGVPIVLVCAWWRKPDGSGNSHQFACNSPSADEFANLLDELAREVRAGSYRPPVQGKPS